MAIHSIIIQFKSTKPRRFPGTLEQRGLQQSQHPREPKEISQGICRAQNNCCDARGLLDLLREFHIGEAYRFFRRHEDEDGAFLQTRHYARFILESDGSPNQERRGDVEALKKLLFGLFWDIRIWENSNQAGRTSLSINLARRYVAGQDGNPSNPERTLIVRDGQITFVACPKERMAAE